MSIFIKTKNSFENQLPEEKTILLTRKHWFVLFCPLVVILILALVPFIIYYFINSFSWYNNISSVYWFLVITFLLILWHLAFYNLMLYALNTLIITNKRIIENKQLGFFKHAVNELELDKVQDVSIKIFGILPEFLRFGNVEIQSAGAIPKFSFNQFPHPEKIKKIIMGLKVR